MKIATGREKPPSSRAFWRLTEPIRPGRSPPSSDLGIPSARRLSGPPGAYVVLLIEFQSDVDATMPVRMLVYTGLLFQELLRQRQGLSEERMLPHVVPLVVYNGRRRWHAPLSVTEMTLPEGAVTAEWQPRQSYLALDEWQRSTDDLPRDNLVSSLVALETSQGKALDLAVAELAGLLNDPVDSQIRRAFRDWIERLRPRRTDNRDAATRRC
ncbi:MAG: Rpn family recombination-promoting nuclease/putative transposase [Gammaproteobacteria bacterium]|nr:Rpn family recombination-promoting nuclease/putative transposase [Gammaproteobacteria bacterium]MYF31714.1 Rpn family recombination-promoting nuclease/putative transposase [Gammaproteobacteria bacterium]MYK46650.1 Rpn family recombination-promoting nuclease/putative transposase [Gammaproteobacteria bacterium]